METLLLGSASAFRLMVPVSSVAAAVAHNISSFLVGWQVPQVRLKPQWRSWWRLNLGREDVLR